MEESIMNGSTIRTFLGANSGRGFTSLYDTFPETNRMIIIKGGPGSGKSSIMKKIAAAALKENYFVEYCYCSSDAESLDGIRIPEKSLCVVDGTAPHLSEPRFPGAKDEIIYTGQFWNTKKLQESLNDIQDLTKRIKGCFAGSYRYLSAAEKAMEEIRSTVLPKTNLPKLRKFATEIARKHIKKIKSITVMHPRFLSGISPQGLILHRDTVYTLAEKVFVLDDPYRISHVFLEAIMESAADCGQEIYLFYDPLTPSTLQHLVFPQSSVAFVTANKTYEFEAQNAYRIHLSRFSDLSSDDKKRCRRAEHLTKACTEEALELLKQEKTYHDDLEEFYIESMDFKKLNIYTSKLLKSIFG